MFALHFLIKIFCGLGCSCKAFWFDSNVCLAKFESTHCDLRMSISCLLNHIKTFWIVSLQETLNRFNFFLIQFILHLELPKIDSFFFCCLLCQSSCQPNIFILHYWIDSSFSWFDSNTFFFSYIFSLTYSYLITLYILAFTHFLIFSFIELICKNTLKSPTPLFLSLILAPSSLMHCKTGINKLVVFFVW